MSATSDKAPKKAKGQSPEARQEALRYNQMMYGPTAREVRPVSKKVNLGSPYLKDPKFLSLMAAFKKGTAFEFKVNDKGRIYPIATDGTHITFDGKAIYYSRPLNRHEENLLMDRSVVVQYQATEALVHLVAAVLRHLPELEAAPLMVLNREVYYGPQSLEAGIAESGPNLLIGAFKHQKAAERSRK